MKALDEILRVLYDAQGDNLSTQVSAAVKGIEAEAAAIRAENAEAVKRDGKTAQQRVPQEELQPKVDLLKGAIGKAVSDTIAAIDGEIEELRSDHEAARDRHPERELAEIRRAENHVRGLTDDQIRALPRTLAESDVHADSYQLNEVRARLRALGAIPELDTLNEVSALRHFEKPWLQTPEAAEMAHYREQLQAVQGGQVLYRGGPEHGEAVIDVADIIDWTGELDAR